MLQALDWSWRGQVFDEKTTKATPAPEQTSGRDIITLILPSNWEAQTQYFRGRGDFRNDLVKLFFIFISKSENSVRI